MQVKQADTPEHIEQFGTQSVIEQVKPSEYLPILHGLQIELLGYDEGEHLHLPSPFEVIPS